MNKNIKTCFIEKKQNILTTVEQYVEQFPLIKNINSKIKDHTMGCTVFSVQTDGYQLSVYIYIMHRLTSSVKNLLRL